MALKIQQQSGLRRVRPYVPGKPIEEVQREYGLEDVIKLASNENPLPPSPKVQAALQEALAQINLYPDGQSYTLRKVLSERLGFPLEQVTVGNGADSLIMELCLAYLDEGAEVLVSQSSFPTYDIYANIMRAQVVKTPLNPEYRLDLAAMARAITERTRLIFVCNPNNPTGTIVLADEVAAFMEHVPDDTLVIFDEAYYEFVDSPAYPDSLAYLRAGRSNVVTLRTFSKVYGLSGLRLGYGVAAPEVINTLHTVKEPFAVNRLAQVAGLAALEDADFVRRTIQGNHEGRQYLYREFARLEIGYLESHANFILARFGARTAAVIQTLLENGIIVRPCTGYDLPEFARITVGTAEQNARLIATLERILPTL